MSTSTVPLAACRPRAPEPEPALPRADRARTIQPTRRRRDRWGPHRRWPFGPLATTVSLALHAVGLGVILWALAVASDPDAIGVQVYAVLTPDLGEIESCPPLDVPEELPEIEVLEPPTPALEPELEPEEELEELESLESVSVVPVASELSLEITAKRVAPPKAVEPPVAPPPAPVVVAPPRPAPPPRPRAEPAPQARGAMPQGRLRPIAKPIQYPESARQAGLEGRARVAMTIDPNGTVVDVQLLVSSGYRVLDEAALASARRWRFAPPGTFRRAAQTFRFSLD